MTIGYVRAISPIVVRYPRDVVGVKLHRGRIAIVLVSDVWQRERQVSVVFGPLLAEELGFVVFQCYWE